MRPRLSSADFVHQKRLSLFFHKRLERVDIQDSLGVKSLIQAPF